MSLDPNNTKLPKVAKVGSIPILQKYLAIRNRGYTGKVRLRGLIIQPAQAGFVCEPVTYSLRAICTFGMLPMALALARLLLTDGEFEGL
ncbi:MAG: hypothetical protein KME30_13185 [Iphinoe sp. HA4291-MV1]|nr:hypothetical protein [Iphinoe sp. HA4291-MV1]